MKQRHVVFAVDDIPLTPVPLTTGYLLQYSLWRHQSIHAKHIQKQIVSRQSLICTLISHVGRFENKSFRAIDCISTVNQTRNNKEKNMY